ncbi:MAG TPA: MarR family transcriptional regulator [Rhizomicrobium sp.]|nr:MarR family transcriptional regulator [Rhizomicrobium sp.]
MSPSRKPLSDADYRHLAEFRYLLRQFLAFSEEAARGAGLSPQHHQALLALRGCGGRLTVGELAQRLAIKPHSAVGLADRLVDAGLAARQIGSKDRRRVELALTPVASRKLAELSQSHRAELKRLAPSLAPLLKNWEKE